MEELHRSVEFQVVVTVVACFGVCTNSAPGVMVPEKLTPHHFRSASDSIARNILTSLKFNRERARERTSPFPRPPGVCLSPLTEGLSPFLQVLDHGLTRNHVDT